MLAFVICALCFGVLTPIQAEISPQATIALEGTLSVIWVDQPQMASVLYTLVTDDGRRIPLDLPPSVLEAAGGVHALFGQRVYITLAQDPAALPAGLSDQAIAVQVIPNPFVENVITGAQSWLNLLCKFSDVTTETYTPAAVTGWFGNTYPQLDFFYRQNSLNAITIPSVTTSIWRSLPSPVSSYRTVPGSNLSDGLFNDCTTAHSAFYTYNNYFGINLIFNDDFIGGGGAGGIIPATLQGVNKSWRVTWLPAPVVSTLSQAFVGHEMGHAMGLPHSNNSDGDSFAYDNYDDIMSGSTCALIDVLMSCLSANTIAYHKDLLG